MDRSGHRGAPITRSDRVPETSIAKVNGSLALMATLASFGGRWLRDGSGPPPELLTRSKSFQYVGSFVAEFPRRRLARTLRTARSPEDWLAALKAEGVTTLSLITDLATAAGALPPHVAASFANGGAWGLLATGKGPATFWTIRWEVGDRGAPATRIWSLTATPHSGAGIAVPSVSVAEARERLGSALAQIRAFAGSYDEVSDWAPWFEKSEALLVSTEPTPPYHVDMLPADALLERRQLAAAVIQGWVFGGMGSWNDCGFLDDDAQREYDRVGADLYEQLLRSVAASANGA